MILLIRRESIRDTDTVREYELMRMEYPHPSGFDDFPAPARRCALSLTGVGQFRAHKFLELGARRNTLRAIVGSLRPAASGMQTYLNICRLLGRYPVAVGADTVLLRSTMFRVGGIFGQYIAHVMKASILLRQPTDWRTSDIKSAPMGWKMHIAFLSARRTLSRRPIFHGYSGHAN